MQDILMPPRKFLADEKLDQEGARVRLLEGSRLVFDEAGHAIAIVNEPANGLHAASGASADSKDETWNPWRQGP